SSDRVGAVAFELASRMAADVGSVGVAAPESARPVVDPAFGLTHAEESDAGLSTGINLLGLGAIKGLEFDAAVVIEPAAILAEQPDGGRGGLYTALTRSTRALAVVHSQPLPFSAPDLHAISDRDAADAWAALARSV